jgi:hypothetical protein
MVSRLCDPAAARDTVQRPEYFNGAYGHGEWTPLGVITFLGLVVGAVAGYLAPMTVLADAIPADWSLLAAFARPILGGLVGVRIGLLLEAR